MPTYQYSCTECGHFLEVVQSFSEDSLTTCPECEGRLRKVFNAVGVVFKGSGFYRTDSRAGSPSGSGDSAGGSGGKDAGAAKADGGSGSKDSSGSKASKESGGSSGASSTSTPKSA